jgi:anti-sigma regulatory factor (Ser/Thr protein kinase)
VTIEWPKNGQIENVIGAYHKVLQGLPEGEAVIFDFRKNAWIEPATVCTLALQILANSKINHSFEGDEDALSYLARLDFFRTIGYDYVERFDRHPDAGRIIPIQKISTSADVRDSVRRICDMASRHLPNARAFVPAMEWTVNEIIDNIMVHSATVLPGLVSAQYYPEQRRMRIGITDAGLGIRATLAERYPFMKDFEAIDKAIERGVTRNLEVGQGNGLAGTVEIASLNRGDLAILSGNGFFRANSSSTNRGRSNINIQGTVVSLNLDTDRPVDLMQTFMAESAMGWSYFDAEAQRLVEGDGLLIRDEVVHTRGRGPAKALRNKICCLLESLEAGRKLRLDFAGVDSASSSFLDELLARLVIDLTQPVFREKIEVVNLSPTVRALAKAVTVQRQKQSSTSRNTASTGPADTIERNLLGLLSVLSEPHRKLTIDALSPEFLAVGTTAQGLLARVARDKKWPLTPVTDLERRTLEMSSEEIAALKIEGAGFQASVVRSSIQALVRRHYEPQIEAITSQIHGEMSHDAAVRLLRHRSELQARLLQRPQLWSEE